MAAPDLDLDPALNALEDSLNTLESALTPLLTQPLRTLSSTLPLLDSAKLHVLTTYAIESLIFSSTALSGASATAHPVFAELARTRTYFAKLKDAERGGPATRPAGRTLDKGAAGRFIRAGLAGNEEHDRERRAREAREKKGALKKFDELSERMEQERVAARVRGEREAERKAQDGRDGESSEDEDESEADEDEGSAGQQTTTTTTTAAGKKRSRRNDQHGHGHGTSKRPRTSPPLYVKQKSSQAPKGGKEAFQALLRRAKDDDGGASETPEQEGFVKKLSKRERKQKNRLNANKGELSAR